MKQLTFLLILIGNALYGQAIEIERFWEDSTIVIKFEYDIKSVFAILTYPPIPHYRAEITVYKIKNGERIIIGETFSGIYTEQGCFEDNPALLVRKARHIKACLRLPDIFKLFIKYRFNNDKI